MQWKVKWKSSASKIRCHTKEAQLQTQRNPTLTQSLHRKMQVKIKSLAHSWKYEGGLGHTASNITLLYWRYMCMLIDVEMGKKRERPADVGGKTTYMVNMVHWDPKYVWYVYYASSNTGAESWRKEGEWRNEERLRCLLLIKQVLWQEMASEGGILLEPLWWE